MKSYVFFSFFTLKSWLNLRNKNPGFCWWNVRHKPLPLKGMQCWKNIGLTMDWSKGTYSYEAMLFPINLLGFLFPVKFPQIQWCKQRRSNKIHLPRHMTHMTLTEQTLGDCRTTSPGEFSTRDWLLFKYHLFLGGSWQSTKQLAWIWAETNRAVHSRPRSFSGYTQ